MELSKAILGENEMKPTKSLVKDGAWNVPASERPKNWESMNLKDPFVSSDEKIEVANPEFMTQAEADALDAYDELTADTPGESLDEGIDDLRAGEYITETVDEVRNDSLPTDSDSTDDCFISEGEALEYSATLQKHPDVIEPEVKIGGSLKKPNKWDWLIARVMNLPIGESISVSIPRGIKMHVYSNQIRSILSMRKQTKMNRWYVNNENNGLKITKVGTHDTRAKINLESTWDQDVTRTEDKPEDAIGIDPDEEAAIKLKEALAADGLARLMAEIASVNAALDKCNILVNEAQEKVDEVIVIEFKQPDSLYSSLIPHYPHELVNRIADCMAEMDTLDIDKHELRHQALFEESANLGHKLAIHRKAAEHCRDVVAKYYNGKEPGLEFTDTVVSVMAEYFHEKIMEILGRLL